MLFLKNEVGKGVEGVSKCVYFLRRRLRCVDVILSSEAMSFSEKSSKRLGARIISSS